MKKFGQLLVLAVMTLPFISCRRFANWHADLSNDIKEEYLIQDANGRIKNYEYFYDQYGAIKAQAQKVNLSEGDDKTNAKMVLISMIGEYNAKSMQSKTSAQWKAADLPYQIDYNDLGVEE